MTHIEIKEHWPTLNLISQKQKKLTELQYQWLTLVWQLQGTDHCYVHYLILFSSSRLGIPNSLPTMFFKVRQMFVNIENPKIISKCFNCNHMLLRNYSVNIWEKHICQFYCAKNHYGNSARDPSRYISGPKAKVPGLVMSTFLQSAFSQGPKGHSNTKNTVPPLLLKTTWPRLLP